MASGAGLLSRRAQLQAALSASVRTSFRLIFGNDYNDCWGAGIRKHIEHLTKQDEEARAAAKYIDRAPKKAAALVDAYGLADESFKPGTAPAMAMLAAEVALRRQGEVSTWRLGKDPIASELIFTSFRSSIIYFFETVPANSPDRPAAPESQGRDYNDMRVLTDAELVVVMTSIDVNSATMRGPDLEIPEADAVREILDRERRLMNQARRRHGSVPAPRGQEEHERERNKTALLPCPHIPSPDSET